MAITVANLVAQIGADLSQWRLGMNEVDARNRLTELRARESDQRVRLLQEKSVRAMSASSRAQAQAAAIQLAPIHARITRSMGDASRAQAVQATATAARMALNSTATAAQVAAAARATTIANNEVTKSTKALTTAEAKLASDRARRTAANTALTVVTGGGTAKQIAAATKAAATAQADVNKASQARRAAEMAVVNAQMRQQTAQLHALGLQSTATADQIAKADKKVVAADTAAAGAAHRLATARAQLIAAQSRQASLIERAGNLRGASAEYMRRAGVTTEEGQAQAEVARAYVAHMAQNAREHAVRVATTVASAAENTGLVVGGALGVATKLGADYNQMLITTAHNTSLTTSGIGVMNDTVRKLGAESGADMTGLAEGFREIENRGYGAGDAVKMLRPAMEAAIAKGSDLHATARLLVNVMKEFSIPVNQATNAMAVLIETSRRSGTEMDELVDVYGRMSASSANLGVSLIDTSAAYVIMTRHGIRGAEAATQFRNDINKIINPSDKVRKVLADLTKATGVDLVRAFSGAGMRANGFIGTFDLIKKAADKYKGGTPVADIVTKLFPLQRGQLGASILTGTGYKETESVLRELTESTRHGAIVNKLYQESLLQINQQLGRIKNAGILAASSIATALAPSIKQATDFINNQAASFNNLSVSTKNSIVQTVGMTAATLVVVGVLGKAVIGVNALREALLAMEIIGAVPMLPAIGAFLVAAAPTIIAIGAVTAALYLLWKVNDDADHAVQRRFETLKQENVTAIQVAAANATHAKRLSELVKEYNRLNIIGPKTTEQTKALHDVLVQIGHLSPDLISGYNAQGVAIGVIADNSARAAANLHNMLDEQTRVAAMTPGLKLSEASKQLEDAKEEKRRILAEMSRGMVEARIEAPTGLGMGMGTMQHIIPARPMTHTEMQSKSEAVDVLTNKISSLITEMKQDRVDMSTAFIKSETSRHGRMTREQISDTALKAGFPANKLAIATAIAMAESTGEATQFTTNTKGRYKGTVDRGLWQINRFFHPELSDAASRDPLANAKAALKISKGGTDWTQWSTFTTKDPQKSYKRFLPDGYDLSQAGVLGGNGIDKTAGLGDKKKKQREGKEDEISKARDKYLNDMESMAHAQFELTNEGKVGEAMWETQLHGVIYMADGVHSLAGAFAALTAAEKKQYIAMAKSTEEVVKAHKAQDKLDELLKNNALKLYEGSAGVGKSRTPAEIEAYKLAHEEYKDTYGSLASKASASNLEVATQTQRNKAEEQMKKLREESLKPLEQTLNTYQRIRKELTDMPDMIAVFSEGELEAIALETQANASEAALKTFKDKLTEKNAPTLYGQLLFELQQDKDMMWLLGETGVEALARLAEGMTNTKNATTLYNTEIQKGAEELAKLHGRIDNFDDPSNLAAKKIELQTAAYKDMNVFQKLGLLMQAEAIDKANTQLDVTKAEDAIKKSMQDDIDQAKTNITGVYSPDEQRFIEFRQKAIERYGTSFATLGKEQRLVAELAIREAFNEITMLNKREAAMHKIADVMDEIKKATEKLTDKIKFQAGGVEITQKVWDKMSASQKKVVLQFQRMAQVKEEVSNILTGIGDLFLKSLNDIREHGFRNFFRNIIAGFDDMLFQLAAKWLQSQFMKLITTGLEKLLGGVLGGVGNMGSASGTGIDMGASVGPDTGASFQGFAAEGGPVRQGMSYIVGERGAEKFTPTQNGVITKNSDLQGGHTFVLNVHGVTDAGSFMASKHQISQTMGRMIAATGVR